MTTPTVPTAPLPSELQAALNYLCENGTFSERKSARTIRSTLLTMQRERDENNGKCAAFEESTRVLMLANDTLTEQLAASERTCAELMQCLDESQARELREFDRAEAAERTVEGLRGKP